MIIFVPLNLSQQHHSPIASSHTTSSSYQTKLTASINIREQTGRPGISRRFWNEHAIKLQLAMWNVSISFRSNSRRQSWILTRIRLYFLNMRYWCRKVCVCVWVGGWDSLFYSINRTFKEIRSESKKGGPYQLIEGSLSKKVAQGLIVEFCWPPLNLTMHPVIEDILCQLQRNWLSLNSIFVININRVLNNWMIHR